MPDFNYWEDDFSGSISDMRDQYYQLGVTGMTPSVASNKFTFSAGSSNITNNPKVIWCPIQLAGALGQDQFCEAVYEGVGANTARIGWAVLAVGDGRLSQDPNTSISGLNQAYLLMTVTSTPAFLLRRMVNGVETTLGSNFSVPSVGTVVALTVTRSGSDNVLEVFYDGVSQGTRTDSNLGMAGLPGLFTREAASGGSFSSFRAGILSLF